MSPSCNKSICCNMFYIIKTQFFLLFDNLQLHYKLYIQNEQSIISLLTNLINAINFVSIQFILIIFNILSLLFFFHSSNVYSLICKNHLTFFHHSSNFFPSFRYQYFSILYSCIHTLSHIFQSIILNY